MKRLLILFTALIPALAFSYEPEPWNLAARRQFANQRFGIFIHWGLYANYAQGEWYLQTGNSDNKNKALDREAYERMMHGFCPSKFDAREWVKIIKGSGARYVTITSRHHDGFSLWPTKVDDGYNIAETPFCRDILGELREACDEEGIQLNFYYSLMDWHRKDYPAGRCARVVLGDQKGDYASYKKFMLAQIGELIENYHPGNIWFDGEWEHASCKEGVWMRTLDWDFDTIYDFIHAKKTLVANNNHQPIRPKEDLQLFERDLPGDDSDAGFSKDQPVTKDRPIEQCDVIQKNVWGYRIGEDDFRTAPDVVAMVARAASKGSNLLMNIGPDGSGQFPARAVAVLKDVGTWFEKNGESIYETDGCPIAVGKDVVSTRRGEILYLHFLKSGVDSITFKTDVDFACATQLVDGKFAKLEKLADGQLKVSVVRPAGEAFDLVVKLVPKIPNAFARLGICLKSPKKSNVKRFCSFVKDRLTTDGIDTLVLATGYRYEFTSHPKVRAADALSMAEVKEIVAACRAAKIKLIPKMNLFGHQSSRGGVIEDGILKAYPDMDESRGRASVRENYCRSLCPRHPDALHVASELAVELAEAFESDVIHIGCDEVFEIGVCSRCAETPTGILFSDWVNALAANLRAKGVSTMIWGDRLVDSQLTGEKDIWESSDNGTASAIKTLDRQIEICDWRYWPSLSYPSITHFVENGYKIWVSPWSNAEAANRFYSAAKLQGKGNIQGILLTTWYDFSLIADMLEGKGVMGCSTSVSAMRVRGVGEVYCATIAGRQ